MGAADIGWLDRDLLSYMIIPLAVNLQHGHDRVTAAWILGETYDKRAETYLVEALNEADEEFLEYVTCALVKVGDSQTAPFLIEMLNHAGEYVRGCSAKALGQIGDSIAIPYLKDVLYHDEKDSVRKIAAESLGMIGDEHAIPILIESIRQGLINTCGVEANALIKFDLEKTIPPLIELLNSEDERLLIETIEALGIIRSPKAVSALLDTLRSKPQVKYTTVGALGAIQDSRAVSHLLELLKVETEGMMRRRLIWAIDNIGTIDAFNTY
jgi:HEAT repeat protein